MNIIIHTFSNFQFVYVIQFNKFEARKEGVRMFPIISFEYGSNNFFLDNK